MIGTTVNRIKRNPAVLIAVLAAVVQALEAQDVVTWNTVLTVVAGVLIRQFVTPAAEVGALEEQAAVDGYLLGAGSPPGVGDFE